jgi:hypothetical protein
LTSGPGLSGLWEGYHADGFGNVTAIYLIHYWFHPRKNWKTVQAFLLVMSVVVGCYTVTAVNKNGYFAVMKRVPPLGTLWVWAVVEMDLLVGAASLLAVAGYTWWNGFAVL